MGGRLVILGQERELSTRTPPAAASSALPRALAARTSMPSRAVRQKGSAMAMGSLPTIRSIADMPKLPRGAWGLARHRLSSLLSGIRVVPSPRHCERNRCSVFVGAVAAMLAFKVCTTPAQRMLSRSCAARAGGYAAGAHHHQAAGHAAGGQRRAVAANAREPRATRPGKPRAIVRWPPRKALTAKAQLAHEIETRVTARLQGNSIKKVPWAAPALPVLVRTALARLPQVKPLADEVAAKTGASVFTESIVFGVASLAIVLEIVRKSRDDTRKEAEKRAKEAKARADLEDRFRTLETAVEELQLTVAQNHGRVLEAIGTVARSLHSAPLGSSAAATGAAAGTVIAPAAAPAASAAPAAPAAAASAPVALSATKGHS